MPARRRSRTLIAGAAVPLLAGACLTGCADKSEGGSADGVRVTAEDKACKVSDTTFPAGNVKFAGGEQGLQGHRGLRPLPRRPHRHRAGEHRPRHQGRVTAEVKAGDYEIACKPGMKGDGIRQKVTATGKGKAAKRDPRAGRGRRRVPQVRAGAGRRDAAQGEGVHRGGQGRRHRGREEGVRRLPHRLGAHRAGRRVLR